MEFRDNEPIYLQIAGYVSEHILLGKWVSEQKIPSVRDLAVLLEVNPNTVMRAYEFLESSEVIFNRRGLGFFVAESAGKMVKAYRRQRFLQHELPEVFRTMLLLDINISEIEKQFALFLKAPKKNAK